MSDTVIKSNKIDSYLFDQWGVTIYDYEYADPVASASGTTLKGLDLQDLVSKVGTKRATAIEQEITALATKMRQRNSQLDWLAALLADLGKAASQFQSDKSNQTANITLSEKTYEALKLLSSGVWEVAKYEASSVIVPVVSMVPRLFVTINSVSTNFVMDTSISQSISQSMYEMLNQLAKSKTDSLNNESQSDMTKLQGWVSKRDEGYSTATSLMTSVSETRSNMIKNF